MKINPSEIIKKLDKKNRYYILLGILIFAFLLDYLILMRPQLFTLAKIKPEIKILSQDLAKIQDDIKKVDSYQNDVDKLQASVAEISQKVKSKEEVSLILEQISRIANQNNIKIDQIMPLVEDQKVLLQDNKKIYYALPILVEARSSYHDLGKFLGNMEEADMFLYLTSFSIAGTEDLRLHKLKMNFQAIVFEEKLK